jgi:hypothetical protein
LARLRGNFIGQPGWFRGQGGFGDSFFSGHHQGYIEFPSVLQNI